MKLYNTLTRSIEPLVPLSNSKIKLYTCGLTVYSQPHIGNWVGYIYWDVLLRVLKAEGYSVERTQNITDVGHLVSDDDSGEDKMEKGAKAENTTAWDLAKKYATIAETEAYDMLHLLRPDHLIKATDCIKEQIEFAKILDNKGYLYKIEDEGMYFDTSKLDSYGELAKLDVEGLMAGARVSVEGKKNVTDFAIWKFSPKNSQRDMEWESPWGVGFPGWHLECSVIARMTLGDSIDIHTGGIDHIQVHHTNEIAQTEAVTGKQFSQFWVHNNHLKVDGTKISKSLGNGYTLSDITDRSIPLDAFKLLILSKHYRREGNFTWEILEAAYSRLQRWYQMADYVWQTDMFITSNDTSIVTNNLSAMVLESLSDDLKTNEAVTVIDAYMEAIEKLGVTQTTVADVIKNFEAIESLLGIKLLGEDLSEAERQLLADRAAAREAKDYQGSDRLRDELLKLGITINDSSRGQLWFKKRL